MRARDGVLAATGLLGGRPEGQVLVYVSAPDYSSSCPPEVTAEAAEGTVTVIFREDPDAGVCTLDAGRATVTIDGLADPPTALSVTDAGDTTTVPVETAPGIMPPRRASESLRVGATGKLVLGVHCGLRYPRSTARTGRPLPVVA
jgi:hypothetical protein